MESNISTNNSKVSMVIGTAANQAMAGNTDTITAAEQAKLGHISVTQAVNLDTMESNISTNSTDITNIESKTDLLTQSGNRLGLNKTPDSGVEFQVHSTSTGANTMTSLRLTNPECDDNGADFYVMRTSGNTSGSVGIKNNEDCDIIIGHYATSAQSAGGGQFTIGRDGVNRLDGKTLELRSKTSNAGTFLYLDYYDYNGYINESVGEHLGGIYWRTNEDGANSTSTYGNVGLILLSCDKPSNSGTMGGSKQSAMKFYTHNGSGLQQYMNLDCDGNLGIGSTPNPEYPLHVMTSNNISPAEQVRYFSSDDTSLLNSDSATTATSIYASYAIYSKTYIMASDRRIKKDIEEVPDAFALNTLRKIDCCYYGYIDSISTHKNAGKTIGFISQQVKEHFPLAVSHMKEFIPDEYRLLVDPIWKSKGDKYILCINDLSNNIQDQRYRFCVRKKNPILPPKTSINEVINEEVKTENQVEWIELKTIEGSLNEFEFEEKWDEVFLYGKEVDDFHALDKNKLFALNFSATQELDRKVQDLEKTVEILKAKILLMENT